MIGLILKDFMNLKKQFKVLGLIILFYFIFSKATNNNSMFGTMVTLVFAMLPITALSFDEKANWDKYGLTMPVSRSEVVISKYILGIIASLSAGILNFVAQLLLGTEINADSLMMISIIFGVSILFFSLLLPIIFQFGVEKGRLLMFIVLALPTLIILLFKDHFDITLTQDLLNKAMYALPLLAIAILILSMLLSILIYKNKEF
jgi:hypothetical protein